MSGKRRRPVAKAIQGKALSQAQLRRLREAGTHYRERRFREAESICRALLKARPDQPIVLDLLGSIFLEQGKSVEAIACYKKVIEQRPGAAKAHKKLGDALKFRGLLDEAAESYRRAIEIEPDDITPYRSLGNLLLSLGRLLEAADCLNRALTINPGDAVAHNSLGAVLMAQGDMAGACAAFQRAVELNPDYPEAHNNLGLIHRELGDAEKAYAHFQRAIELKPEFAMAHKNLGNWFFQNSRFDEAVATHERAIALKPDFGDAYCSLGNSLKAQGKLDQAVAAYRRAIDLNSTDAYAHSNLGTVYQEQNKISEALACYERAVALKPDFASAIHHLAHLKTYRAEDPQISAMKSLLERPNIRNEDKGLLLFALGVIHDKLCRYDEAFGYLSQANSTIRQSFTYDSSQNEKYVDRLIDTFDDSMFAGKREFGHESERPVFVVGMPRSGKTRVETILGSHPDVYEARETYELGRIVGQLPGRLGTDRPFPECIDALTPGQARELGEDYVTTLSERSPDAKRITNTRPDNFQLLGLIRLLLPRARIIHCTRDPLDNCFYCFIRNYPTQPFAYDLVELGAYYVQYQRLMNHWRGVLDVPILEVRYEHLIANPVEVGREIFSFCDLDWNTARTRSPRSDDGTSEPDGMSFPFLFHKREIGGSRNYEAHLQPLKRLLEQAS